MNKKDIGMKRLEESQKNQALYSTLDISGSIGKHIKGIEEGSIKVQRLSTGKLINHIIRGHEYKMEYNRKIITSNAWNHYHW